MEQVNVLSREKYDGLLDQGYHCTAIQSTIYQGVERNFVRLTKKLDTCERLWRLIEVCGCCPETKPLDRELSVSGFVAGKVSLATENTHLFSS